MKRVLSFLALLVTLSSLTYAKIIETDHFEELCSYVAEDTLIILDIDDTLLIPTQMLGCDEWFLHQLKKHQNAGMNYTQALEKGLAEWEAIRHLTKMKIVEPGTEKIIAALQKQNCCIIGLTTQGLALATRTSKQLKEHHIDLTITAPSKEDVFFQSQGHGLLFRNGILFTSATNKGEALFKLCEKIGYSPKRIIFINDKETHVKELEMVAEKKQVECVGLRYAYADAHKAAFRPEVAEYQFSHSSFDKILSDEEALAKIVTP